MLLILNDFEVFFFPFLPLVAPLPKPAPFFWPATATVLPFFQTAVLAEPVVAPSAILLPVLLCFVGLAERFEALIEVVELVCFLPLDASFCPCCFCAWESFFAAVSGS